MKNVLFGLIVLTISYSSFGLEVDKEFEQVMCSEFRSLIPEHATSVWSDPSHTVFLGYDNKYDWDRNLCSIERSSYDYDYFEVDIDIKRKDKVYSNGLTIKGGSLLAKVSCLFNSSYVWSCYYSYLDHDLYASYFYVQTHTGRKYQNPKQSDILEIITSQANTHL